MYASDLQNNITPYAFGNELAWLRNSSKDLKYAVMIGAGPGVMGLALMEGNLDLNLLVIDIATCYYIQEHMRAAGFHAVGYAVANSVEYGKDYAGPKLDLLIIDGDHTQEGVIGDVKAWFRHIKPDGLLFFHDYININEDTTNGVQVALDYLVKEHILVGEVIDTPGISIVYKKDK